MTRPLVYLAGPIAGKDVHGSVNWRKHAARRLSDAGIATASPMRGKEHLEGHVFNAQEIPGVPFAGANEIYRRDRWDCMRSDLVLANLEEPSYDVIGEYNTKIEMPSLGTVMEIAWADAAGVFTVAVIPDGSVHDHVLVKQACGLVVQTLDSALVAIPDLLSHRLYSHTYGVDVGP